MFCRFSSLKKALSSASIPQQPSRRISRFVSILLASLTLAGCASYTSETARTPGEFTDDAAIQTIIKSKYLADRQISGLKINVDVRRGVVSLYGPVPTDEVRIKAITIAEAVKGVTAVEDNLVLTGG